VKRIILIVFGCSAWLNPVISNANDSTAYVSTGGITFLKSEDIRMVQEVLEISPGDIKVRYRFLNESDKDINATIAFPMPSYTAPNPYVDDPNGGPLRPFSTWVNGKLVQSKIDRKAVDGERDITPDLRKIGLDDKQIFETFALCPDQDGDVPKYCGLTKNQEKSIEDMRVVGSWWVDETALWELVFPSHQEIEVLHEYEPKTGGRYYEPYQHGKYFGEVITHENVSPDCGGNEEALIDKRIHELAQKGADFVTVSVAEVSYILLTGKNWKGPITDFKLRIIKNTPDQIISVCFPGKPKRLGDSTFEFSQHDFVPKDDLHVYFYDIN
jgi:Domain of unknown function (DUF4424)